MNLTFNAGHKQLPKSFLSNSPLYSHVSQIDWWNFLIFRFTHLQPLFRWLSRTFYLFLSICLLSDFFFFSFLAMLCVMWDSSSLTRDRTYMPCIGSEAWSLNHWTTRVVPLFLSLFFWNTLPGIFIFPKPCRITVLNSSPNCFWQLYATFIILNYRNPS